jgi:hypothetical protein
VYYILIQKNTCPNPLKPLQNWCKETNLNMLGQSIKPKWMVEIDLKEITGMIIPLRKVLGAFIIAYSKKQWEPNLRECRHTHTHTHTHT